VWLWNHEYLETIFPDGGVARALFVRDHVARSNAWALGYRRDVRRMHLEHELAHTFLAEERNLPYSPVLRHVAGGPQISSEARAEEEALVFAFVAYIHSNVWDKRRLGTLTDVPAMAARFQTLVAEFARYL
jgi:hypothetical protein